MNFDFQSAYAAKTNQELLLIVSEPGKYQDTAVKIANNILAEREVTEQERQEVYALLHKATEIKDQPAGNEPEISIFDDLSVLSSPGAIWIRNWIIASAFITIAKPLSGLWADLIIYISLFFEADALSGISMQRLLYDAFYVLAIIGAVRLIITKTEGWHLTVLYSSMIATTNLLGLIKYMDAGNTYLILTSLGYAALHGTVIGILLTPTIRGTFRIDPTWAVLNVVITALATFILCTLLPNVFFN